MNLKQYIIFLFFGTVLSTTAWILVINNIDPITAPSITFMAFYVTLFLSVTGILSTVFTMLRSLRKNEITPEHIITGSLRQSVLLSLLLIVSLFLIKLEYFNLITGFLLIVILAIFEFLFLRKGAKEITE